MPPLIVRSSGMSYALRLRGLASLVNEQEQDAVLGRTLREYRELQRAAAIVLEDLSRIGAQARSLGYLLETHHLADAGKLQRIAELLEQMAQAKFSVERLKHLLAEHEQQRRRVAELQALIRSYESSA